MKGRGICMAEMLITDDEIKKVRESAKTLTKAEVMEAMAKGEVVPGHAHRLKERVQG
jgi:hypothetical protein